MTITEQQILAELRAEMKILITSVKTLTDKMDALQKEHVTEMSSRMAVAEEKINRLEKILYGTMAVVAVQALALIIKIIA